MRRLIGLLTAVFVVCVPLVAGAAPTCTGPVPQAVCGNRVVAPPLQSAQFIQYGLEYEDVLTSIAAIAPQFTELKTLGEWIGDPSVRSAGGRQMWALRITDESVPAEGKRQVALSLSVHGNERAGLEGGTRYAEDIIRWAVSDPHHKIYAGDKSVEIGDVLRETEIYIADINVDGWAAGDITSGGALYDRANENGADLNRDFPTIGWSSQTQPDQPEVIAWTRLVSSFPNLAMGTDIHGELTSDTNSFSDIMYPAGQWTPRQQMQELAIASDMKRTVERKFAEEGVALQTVFDALGEDNRPMKPANFATAYDIVGYDDSGFMGDWYVREGAIEVDVENFASHTVPNNMFIPALEQAHVAAVKGNLEAVIAESMMLDDIQADLDLGRVAYVFDPARLQRAQGDQTQANCAVEDCEAYDASRMDYFQDLSADAGEPVTPLAAADIATMDLSQYDSIVVDDMIAPADLPAEQRGAYVAALDAFARNGGQLVLTDRALQMLPELRPDAIGPNDIKFTRSNAGHVDFGTQDDAWEADLTGVPSQTFYAVPLGYTASNQAPHYAVTNSVWTAAGGTTVGTINTNTTDLGRLTHGDGQIAIFGAILPTQGTAVRNDHGLADYAVTVAGGQVLHAILEYQRG